MFDRLHQGLANSNDVQDGIPGQSRRALGSAWRFPGGDLWFLVPILGLYAFALVLPLVTTLDHGIELGVDGWLGMFSNSLIIKAAFNTIWYSALVTAVAVVLAYTVAAAIWRCGYTGRIVLTLTVLLSFWTSVLVKIVAWNALMRNNGIFNSILLSLGWIDEPLHLFPGSPAMILGMIQYALPFAVFPILGVMLRQDRRLELAAESLGSTPWGVFRYVVLPLTLPGVLASALLVFVLVVGFYVIPEALGQPNDLMVSNVVALYALKLVDFRVASAVAIILLAVVALLTFFYQHMDRKVR